MVLLLTSTCYLLFGCICLAVPIPQIPEMFKMPKSLSEDAEVTTQITTEMTTENFDKTDLPQQLIDTALFHDYGKYTPQTFDYHNAQNARFPQHHDYNDTCIESYMRCLLNHDKTEGACAINQHFYINADAMENVDFPNTKQFWNAHSYCDIFFDNCRRGYRVWRIINWNGKCVFNQITNRWSPWMYFQHKWP